MFVNKYLLFELDRCDISIPTEVNRKFFFASCGSLIPFTRANAQWVFHGLHIAL